MTTPFTGSIIGSWIVTASSVRDVSKGPPPVSHFTAEGAFYQEVEIETTRFVANPLRYEFAEGKLTLFFRNGAESQIEVVEEPEGAIKARRSDGQTWSKVRLAAPELFSLAFVDAAGTLQRLDVPPKGPRPGRHDGRLITPFLISVFARRSSGCCRGWQNAGLRIQKCFCLTSFCLRPHLTGADLKAG